MATNTTSTIVYFHIGRGGRFFNSGHRTFCGAKNIIEVLQANDSNGNWNFINRENASDVRKKLENKGLTNLIELFEECQDNDNDFAEFEKRTGLNLGELCYTDSNGNVIITVAEAETGIGVLCYDGDYDTDICKYLHECDEYDLLKIADSNEWNKEKLLKEYFDNHTDLKIDWSKFNDNYTGLIEEYFLGFPFEMEDYYNETE